MELFLWLGGIVLVAAWLGVVVVGPPYVPTHAAQLKRLFDELKLDTDDHVVDLGAGDGRVLQLAARHGARATGVEINPFLVWIARWRLRKEARTTVVLGDIWHYQLPADTTYVFVFFAHRFMPKLDDYLRAQRKRVTLVSYGFLFEDRTPDRVIGAFNIYEFR